MSSKSILAWQNIWKDFLLTEFKQLSSDKYNPPYSFINESDLYDKDEQDIVPRRFVPIAETQVIEDIKPIEAVSDNDPMPEEPTYPAPEDCCGSGCRICVYDQYEIDYERYEKNLEKWKTKHGQKLENKDKDKG